MTCLVVGYIAGYIDDFPCVAEISLIGSSVSNIYDDNIIDTMNAKYLTNGYSIKNITGENTYDNIRKFIPHKSLILGADVVFDEDIRSCPTMSLAFYRNYDIVYRLVFGMSSGMTPVVVDTYHDNGSIESCGTYIAGVKHGLTTYYDTLGNITDTIEYNMGSIKKDKDVESLTRFMESSMQKFV
jgi:hypothetical protein